MNPKVGSSKGVVSHEGYIARSGSIMILLYHSHKQTIHNEIFNTYGVGAWQKFPLHVLSFCLSSQRTAELDHRISAYFCKHAQ